MAPMTKRKRGDRTYSQDSSDGSNRPSPHRPQNLGLAQHNHYGDAPRGRGRGRGRARGGYQNGRSPTTPNAISPVTNQSPTAMLPPGLNTAISKPASGPGTTSQTSTPVQNRPAPAPPPPTGPVASPEVAQVLATPLRPFLYEYITDKAAKAWRETGRKSLVDVATKAIVEDDTLVLTTVYEEVIRAGIDGRIDPQEAGKAIQEIVDSDGQLKLLDKTSLFLDTLSVVMEEDPSHPSFRSIVRSAGVDPNRMRAEMEFPTLQTLGLVRSTFKKMAIRKTTQAIYRQSAYNLLREESEGYSKLMTEYFTTVNNEPPTGEVVADLFTRVKGLIGAFDLDVGRVLDVTLDVFANLLVKHYRFFIKFLRTTSWWPKEKSFHNVRSVNQGFTSLPAWALPGSPTWTTSDDERERLAVLKDKRDRQFWIRVKEAGVKAFLEIGRRRIIEDNRTEAEKAQARPVIGEETDEDEMAAETDKKGKKDKKKRKILDADWVSEFGTFPPLGNSIAAQLLGFKLRFYASNARDISDTLPDNLIYLAALLIKIGFISLRDLYPHLYPVDEDMEAVKERLFREKAEREKKNKPGGGGMNALTMAGALADDTVPAPIARLRDAEIRRASSEKPDALSEAGVSTPAKEEEPKEKLPEPVDQKVALLKSLLCIGAIPESLYILGKFPWLVDVYPDLPDYIHRILHQCLNKVYDNLRPLGNMDDIRAQKNPVVEQAGLSKGQLKLADPVPRKTLRWAQLDRNDAGDGVDYRFYWDDWADNIPVCQTVDDVFLLCSSFLNYTGVKIGQDPKLLMKLARIGKYSLGEDPSDWNYERWIDLSKRLLVPALSLTKTNSGVINEMFELLKLFSTKTRYSIYAEWYTGQISRLPDIKVAFDQAKAETKDVLKRISKTNTKPMARALAKVAYSSPGIVFSVALGQIESYENLIEVVVECARYFTYLGYDVLTWSLLNSLGGRVRDRVQADGMLTSSWLRALSQFAGRVFKRFSVMNPTPVLQYVCYQLRQGNATDLEVLEQTLSSMAGIRSDISFNESQTQAMAGGDVLQSCTLEQLHDKRHETRSSSRRLMKSLIEPGLAGPLLISIALERQVYIYRESSSNAPLKVLGNNLDNIHQVFVQYLEVLRSNTPPKDFEALVPDAVELISSFGLDPPVAFMMARPGISHAMNEYNTALKLEKKEQKSQSLLSEKSQTNGDVRMAEVESQSQTTTKDGAREKSQDDIVKSEATEPEVGEDGEVKKPIHETESSPTPAPPAVEVPWHPILRSLMEKLKPVLPEIFEDSLSLSFYVSFWQLSLHDMLVPTSMYEEEIKRQRDKVAAVNSDRSDLSVQGLKRKEQKKKELNELMDSLRTEMKSQVATYQQVRNRLQKEKLHWFTSFPMAKGEAVHNAIIQECFLPRLLLSPLDALYTYKMLISLHSSGTPGFRTMQLIDKLLKEKQFAALIFQCTARESENLGRFLNELLKELQRWHGDSIIYVKMAHGTKKDLPGFAKKLRPDRTPETLLDYEDFRRLLYKWHSNLFNAFKACFNGGEYMHIRNAIIVLRATQQQFPAVNWMGTGLLNCVTDLTKTDGRDDLKLAATSLLSGIKKREKDWMLPQAFRINETGLNAPRSASRSGSTRPVTPQPGSNTPKLNATAPEFKLKAGSTNGVRKLSSGAKDVEDGEIDDLKAALGPNKRIDDANATQVNAKSSEEHMKQVSTPEESQEAKAAPAVAAVTTPMPETLKLAESSQGDAANSNAPADEGPPVNLPVKPDTGRGASGASTPIRTHALPTRPENQQQFRGRQTDRPNERVPEYHGPPRQDTRMPTAQDYDWQERPRDSRENYNDRRELSPSRRSSGRGQIRPEGMEMDRRDPSGYPSRDARDFQEESRMRPPQRALRSDNGRASQWSEGGRESRDRLPPPETRPPDIRARPPQPNSMGPPGSASYNSNRGPPLATERSYSNQSSQPDRLPPINPDRTALADGDTRGRPELIRAERDRRDRGSRPQSPGRAEERAPPGYAPRGDPMARGEYRDDRGPPSDRQPGPAIPPYPRETRDRRDEPSSAAPLGPRTSRNDLNESNHRSRELFQPMQGSRQFSDPNHGRLNQGYGGGGQRPQQDPNYGRLNNDDTDMPPATRGPPTTRTSRNFTAPQQHGGSRMNDSGQPYPPSPSSDRPMSSGFTDRRGEHRDSYQQHHQPHIPHSPAHPQDSSAEVSVHPSRARQIDLNTAPSPQSDYPLSSRGPPRQRQGPANSNIGAHSRNMASSPGQGPERRSDDKRFSNLHNIIHQDDNDGPPPSFERNPERGASILGRAKRFGPGGNASHSFPSQQGSEPSGPPSRSYDNAASERPDLMAGRGHGGNTFDAGAESSSRGGSDQDYQYNRSLRESRTDRRTARYRSISPSGGGSEREGSNTGRPTRPDKQSRGGDPTAMPPSSSSNLPQLSSTNAPERELRRGRSAANLPNIASDAPREHHHRHTTNHNHNHNYHHRERDSRGTDPPASYPPPAPSSGRNEREHRRGARTFDNSGGYGGGEGGGGPPPDAHNGDITGGQGRYLRGGPPAGGPPSARDDSRDGGGRRDGPGGAGGPGAGIGRKRGRPGDEGQMGGAGAGGGGAYDGSKRMRRNG